MDYTGKKFSILGDSISTLRGVTDDDPYTFYTRTMCRKGGLSGADDTWWMRLITTLGGSLERVNAYSGSCISDGYGLGRGACTMERISALGAPDVICILMGANDIGSGVPESVFRDSYALMLSRLRQTYPQAQVWCATTLNGQKVLSDEPYFHNENPATPLEPINTIIRECAADGGAHVADIGKYNILYDAIDGAHPTAHGMEQLAGLWQWEMTGSIPDIFR